MDFNLRLWRISEHDQSDLVFEQHQERLRSYFSLLEDPFLYIAIRLYKTSRMIG